MVVQTWPPSSRAPQQQGCGASRLPVRRGLAAARNAAGIDVARGEFLAFLEDDDVLLHGLRYLRRPELLAAATSTHGPDVRGGE